MRNRHHLPTGLLLLGMAATAPAQAQCLSCSTQMLQSTLTSNVHRSTNQALNRDNHSRDARNGICYDANRHLTGCNGEAASAGNGPGQQAQRGDRIVNGVPAATRKRSEEAAFAVIRPEVERRTRADGQASAAAWGRAAGHAVGAAVKNLAPEYARRAKIDGRASADRWYVDQTRSLAKNSVGNIR